MLWAEQTGGPAPPQLTLFAALNVLGGTVIRNPPPKSDPNRFEHLNLAARREGVSSERPRSKREVIEFEKVILKFRRPNSP
jgi:hypothetical protein